LIFFIMFMLVQVLIVFLFYMFFMVGVHLCHWPTHLNTLLKHSTIGLCLAMGMFTLLGAT
jgi:hypothetical protein